MTEAFAFIRDSGAELGMAEAEILKVLAFHRNPETGQCNPSQGLILAESRMDVRTLRAAMKKLVALGVVSFTRSGIGAPTFYTLHFSTVQIPTVQKCTVQKSTEQICIPKGTKMSPATLQICTPNQKEPKENHKTGSCAPVARAPAAQPKKRPAITHPLLITELPEQWRDYCAQVRPDLDPDRVWTSFRFYWTSGRGSGTRRSDKSWNSTWQTWVRKESEGTRREQPMSYAEMGEQIARELAEEDAKKEEQRRKAYA